MVVASLSTSVGGGWSLTGLAGGVIDGALHALLPRSESGVRRIRNALGPGAVIGVALSRTWIEETSRTPFLSTSFKLAASYIPVVGQANASDGLFAMDLRASLTVGKTIGDVFTPYLSVRAFGGPILWMRVDGLSVGTDRYHVQVALGASLHVPLGDGRTLTATIDASPALERSLSAGAAVSF